MPNSEICESQMKITIVTATYNCAHLIDECLESVANQSAIASIEHIIIDGGSTDSTLQVVARYDHVQVVFSKRDRGIYHAFNRGIQLATGDIIYFLGADDSLYDTEIISSVITSFSECQVDYIATRVRCVNDETGEVWLTDSNIDQNLSLCHQGFFCKTSLFEQIGLFNECFKLCADRYFMHAAISGFHGKSLDLISANFRQGGVSSTNDNRLTLKREQDVISMLLGETQVRDQHHLDKNILDVKALLYKVVKEQISCSQYVGKRVGIFGTRQMSLIVAQLLSQGGVTPICFVVSEVGQTEDIDGISVVGLNRVQGMALDYIINCIEGTHEHEVSTTLCQISKSMNVVSWRDL